MALAIRRLLVQSMRRISLMLFAVLLILVLRIPFVSGGAGAFIPDVALILVYYYTLHRPSVVPHWMIFLLGIFVDLMDGAPVGSSSMVLLLSATLLHNQRRFFMNRQFTVTWVGFAVVCIGAKALSWAILSLAYWQVLLPMPILLQMLASILSFPIFGWILGRFEHHVL